MRNIDTNWTIEVVYSANREIRALHKGSLKREALEAILGLREDAVPEDSKPLRGFPGCYRIPFGRHQYRILYRVIPRKKLIRILRVRHRANAYVGF